MYKINRKDANDARLMLFRQAFIIPLRFLRSLIIIPLLPQPTIFLLKVISTWFGYLPRLTLGTNAILGFYYPAAEAKGDHLLQNSYASLAWRFVVFASITGAIVGVSIAYFYIEPIYIPFLMFWGLSVAPSNFIRSYLTAKGDFRKIALIDVVTAISNFVFPLAGWFLFNFLGYIGGSIISFLFILFIGRKELLPPFIALSKKFATNSIGTGLHFWLNGFLSDLAKTFEVTLFVILAVSKDFGGQYAVGMTLAKILNQLMRSFSTVFQRKAVKQISNNLNTGYRHLISYMVIDAIIFAFFYTFLILATHILVFFLPNYASLTDILPFLLFGMFYMRFRFYSGLAFKTEENFLAIHLGHIVHIIAAIIVVLGIYSFKLPNFLYASGQLFGSILGTTLVSGLFFARNRTVFQDNEGVKILILSFILLLMMVFVYIIDNIYFQFLALSVTTLFITVYIINTFPGTKKLLLQLVTLRMRR